MNDKVFRNFDEKAIFLPKTDGTTKTNNKPLMF